MNPIENAREMIKLKSEFKIFLSISLVLHIINFALLFAVLANFL